jgi:hypothetical protein
LLTLFLFFIGDDLTFISSTFEPVQIPGPIIANNLPTNWNLSQNYPNPFNPRTKINYAVKDGFTGNVKIAVYNIRGEKVADLVNGQHQPGFYTAVFNAAGLSSGVYYYQIQTKDFNALKMMMILK